MKTFQEWAKERYLQEGFGFEDDRVENIDEKLKGIRETLKNALAGNKLGLKWGDLGMRVTNLAEVLPTKKQEIEDLRRQYDQLIAPISQAYQTAVGMQNSDARLKLTQDAMKDASDKFPTFRASLMALGSGSIS